MEQKNWLTIDDLSKILLASPGAIRVRLHRNQSKIKTIYEIISTGRQLQISVESLIENKWITADQVKSLTVRQSVKMDPSSGNRLLVSSIVRKNFSNLTSLEEDLLSMVPQWRSMKRTELVQMLAQLLGVSRAWLYRDHSNDKRSDKDSAFTKLDTDQQLAVQGYLIKKHTPKLFVQACINDETLPDLSVRTWYRINSELKKVLHFENEFVTKGPIALRQSTPSILRDRTHLKPLEVIVGDYWRVDRIVKWVDGELVMPYLCVWIDWRTYKIVGYALAKTPNSLGVKTALFVCFTQFGIPQYAYMDNGKEFRAMRVSGSRLEEINTILRLDEVDDLVKQFEYKGIITGLGIKDINAIFKNPRAKIIERAFGRGGFTDWAKEFQDWTGAKYWQQPEWLKMNVTRYRSEKKVRNLINTEFTNRNTGEFFQFADYFDLAASIREYIERHNNRISSGHGMDEQSPNQIWEILSKQHTVRRVAASTIAFHFLEGSTKKVRRDGKIEFKRHFFYESSRLPLHRLEDVFIKYNPIDGFWFNRPDGLQHEFLPKSLLVFDAEGRFIDEALYCERAHPINEPNLPEMMKKQGDFQRQVRESVKSITSGESRPALPVVDTKSLTEEAKAALPDPAEEERKRKDENKYRNKFI
jgi:hypothetical protein